MAIVGAIVLVLMGLLLGGCNSESVCDDLYTQNAALEKDSIDLRAELENLGDEYDSILSEHEIMRQELESLQTDYQDLLQGTGGSSLRNPTWQELKRFLELDNTDENEYIADEFDCEGFSITIRDNSVKRGFRAAFVAIGFGEGNTGHALIAFDTVDEGLAYVDNTQHDAIGYVEVGKVYGAIALDGVKEQYVNCNMQPGEFWQSLKYVQYSGNMFAYSYYENYSSRRQFYASSIEAYNIEVREYNSAVAEFNKGGGAYSYSQVDTWGDKLADWSDNLEELDQDLGSSKLEPMGIVSSVEMYWN